MSSRLIIQNLPPNLTLPTLRAHLLQPPELASTTTLTDLKLVPHRRFAFVGYKNEEEANRVKGWFDGSVLKGGGKVKVDFVDDETLVNKKTKHTSNSHKSGHGQPAPSFGSSSSSNVIPTTTTTTTTPGSTELKNKNMKETTKGSKALDEFMSVMKSSTLSPTSASASASGSSLDKVIGRQGGQDEDEGEDEEGQEVDDAEWLRRRQRAILPPSTGEGMDVDLGVDMADAKQPSSTSTSTPPPTSISPEESLILTTHRLFLRNLSFTITAPTLQSFLLPYLPTQDPSKIIDIHLPIDKLTGKGVGMAYVTFEKGEDAVRVWKHADGRVLEGRLVHVLPGRGRRGEGVEEVVGVAGVERVDGSTGGTANEGGLFGKVLGKDQPKNHKLDVDTRRKEESRRGLNWASVYMNSDAVVSSIAARMGIKKSDILNPDRGLLEDADEEDEGKRASEVNGAVKLALAETSVINETKRYFEAHGVVLTRLEGTSDVQDEGRTATSGRSAVRTPRSKTILLVKNIPYGTTLAILNALFEPYGPLKRTLLPPAGTLAVVEFEREEDAFRAFKGVNYKRLGNALVYLEKAPEGLVKDGFEGDGVGGDEGQVGQEGKESGEVLKRVKDATAAAEKKDDDDDDTQAAEPGSTLYVKNLSFTTTTERLASVFSSLPSFAFARVSTKPDPKHPNGPRLSMGFGFVGFKTRDAADKALKGLKGYKLDGHELEVKFAQRDREGDELEGKRGAKDEGKKGGKTTKMIVKNVPFEATKKDIKDLFSAYGTLKSCRIPKKHNSGGRGFAFLDFTTRAEAEAVMDALKHTHLLGRHLVLEWAQAEEEFAGQEVERLREKAKREFVKDGEGLPSKKRKLGLKDGLAVGGAEED